MIKLTQDLMKMIGCKFSRRQYRKQLENRIVLMYCQSSVGIINFMNKI